MAGDSGSPFTVTLGTSGRVVKRRSGGSDGRCSGDSGLVLGAKRNIKDRLETGGYDSLDGRKHNKSKRHKKENSKGKWGTDDSNDSCLDKRDLRYTILEKKSKEPQKMGQSTTRDLRDMLLRKTNSSPSHSRRQLSETSNDSRKNTRSCRTNLSPDNSRRRPSETTHDSRKNMPRRNNVSPDNSRRRPSETTRDSRKNMLDSRDRNMLDSRDSYYGGRQSIVERGTYDGGKQITHEPRDAYAHERQSGRQYRDSYADEREIIRQPGNSYNHGRQDMLDQIDSFDYEKQCVPEPRESYDCGRRDGMSLAPPSRTSSNFPTVDMGRNTPSSWPYENLRQRSPDRSLCSSVPTPYFPERNTDELYNPTLISPYGDVNSNLFRRNDISSPPRASRPGTFMMPPPSHAVSSFPATRPMPLVEQYPQMSGFTHNVPYNVEQTTVGSFLRSLGLEKFTLNFMAEEVDFNAMKEMTDADLKELNIPMGPRKKILQALAPLVRRKS